MSAEWRDPWSIRRHEQEQIAGMTSPVRCTHCRRIYDLGRVEVTARYLDCTCWVSPCCQRRVDDRKPPWKHRADIEELSR